MSFVCFVSPLVFIFGIGGGLKSNGDTQILGYEYPLPDAGAPPPHIFGQGIMTGGQKHTYTHTYT